MRPFKLRYRVQPLSPLLPQIVGTRDQVIFITGYAGAGKTILANTWEALFGIPVLHLDDVIQKHKDAGVTDRDKREDLVNRDIEVFISSNFPCIVEGVFLLYNREWLECSQTVVLTTSIWQSSWNAAKRDAGRRFRTVWQGFTWHLYKNIRRRFLPMLRLRFLNNNF